MSSVAVILAASPGHGFTSSKYTTVIHGTRLLDAVISDALTWPVERVLVVLGSDAEAVEADCDLSQVSVLVDPEWFEGSASSMRAVLDFVSRDRDASMVVIARGDQPGVDADVVGTLIALAEQADAVATIPKYRYAIGWPVVLGRDSWDLFLGLEGEMHIHDVLRAHGVTVDEAWFDQIAPTTYETAGDVGRS